MDSFEDWRLGKCLFQCKVCKKEFRVSPAFWHHVMEDHKIEQAMYAQLLGSGLVLSEKIRCQLCNKEILFEFGALKSHMTKQHDGVDLKSYYHTFIDSKGLKISVNKKDPEQSTKEDSEENIDFSSSSNCDQNSSIESNEQEIQFRLNDNIPEDLKTWANQCIYNCYRCTFITQIFDEFHSHVKNCHKMNLSMYDRIFGNFQKMVKLYSCKLCGEIEMHDLYFLARHMEDVHNHSVAEYYKLFIVKKDESVLHRPRQTESGRDKSQDKNDPKPKIGHELNLRKRKTHRACDERSTNFIHPNPQKRYPWLGKCTFYCTICSQELDSGFITSFTHHLRVNHDLSCKEYMKRHGNFYLKKVFHRCLICNKNVENDGRKVRSHLIKIHSMPIAKYHIKYRQTLMEKVEEASLISFERKKDEEDDEEDAIGIQNWWNQCVYTCQICGYFSSAQTTFFHHLNKRHGLNSHQYCKRYGDPMTRKIYSNCHICKGCILMNYHRILLHLKRHNLSIYSYYSRYIKGRTNCKTSDNRNAELKDQQVEAQEIPSFESNEDTWIGSYAVSPSKSLPPATEPPQLPIRKLPISTCQS